jgi:hypothetical protein
VRKRNAYVIFVGITEGNRPLGRPGRKWQLIIKWILKKSGVIRADINLLGG